MKSAFKFRLYTRDVAVLSFTAKAQSRRLLNPNFFKEVKFANGTLEIYGHTTNCQRCVIAHEMRMRGYDVVARPSWGERDTLKTDSKWFGAFEYSPADFVKCTGTTGVQLLKSATQIMRSFGDGARAFVMLKSRGKTNGHVIVAENRGGRVNFGDPQTREIGAIRLFLEPNLENVTLFRVDKLSFTDKVKLFCMTGSEFDDLKRSRSGGRKLRRRQSSQRKRLRRFLVYGFRKRRATRRRSRETPVP